jgi:hypothetical protein
MMNISISLQYGLAAIPGLSEITPVAIHAARSRSGKCLTFHVHLQGGAHYSLLPIDKIFHKAPETKYEIGDLQPWSCFSDSVEYVVFDKMRFSRVMILPLKTWGSYIGTFDWLDNDYSDMPEEFKQGHFIALDNGQYGVFPNNMLLFHDKTWTGHDLKAPEGIKRNDTYPNPEWGKTE